MDCSGKTAPPAPHLEMVTKMYVGPLPGHPDSGKPITRTFATVGEMRDYARERRQAALAYFCPERKGDNGDAYVNIQDNPGKQDSGARLDRRVLEFES
jgi:hypothetical protein